MMPLQFTERFSLVGEGTALLATSSYQPQFVSLQASRRCLQGALQLLPSMQSALMPCQKQSEALCLNRQLRQHMSPSSPRLMSVRYRTKEQLPHAQAAHQGTEINVPQSPSSSAVHSVAFACSRIIFQRHFGLFHPVQNKKDKGT